MDRRKFITGGAMATGALFLAKNAAGKSNAAKGSNSLDLPGYDFAVPGLKKGCVFLFQGDSITDMKRGRNESDRNHYLGHSYVYLIAARLGVAVPNAGWEFHTRGVSGNRISQLRSRWEKDAINVKPDILSILIGTNDASGKIPLDKFETDYRYILSSSKTANPKLKLILMEPFVLPVGRFAAPAAYKKRRKLIDGYRGVVSKMAKEFDAILLETQKIFDQAAKTAPPSHWIWDGIHPMPQGHELMARHWIQKASERWPAKNRPK